MNLEKLRITIKTMGEYLFPVEKVTSYFKSIKSKSDLKKFIQQRSAHVTQTTLYGYLKTRIGVKYTAMVDDEVFSKSINIAKWNIYVVAISDLTFYVFSYLINLKNLKENNAKKIFNNIIDNEKKNGLDEKVSISAKNKFDLKINSMNWDIYHLDEPFKDSGLALYNWSPIADDLKKLDREIVLNSIKLKWNLVQNDFKDLTKDLNFS